MWFAAMARSQARTPLPLRVELRAEPLDVPVEPLFRQHPIHRPIEWMALRPQLLMCDEQVLLLALALSHCHASILHSPRSRVDLDQAFRSHLQNDFHHGLLDTTEGPPPSCALFALFLTAAPSRRRRRTIMHEGAAQHPLERQESRTTALRGSYAPLRGCRRRMAVNWVARKHSRGRRSSGRRGRTPTRPRQ